MTRLDEIERDLREGQGYGSPAIGTSDALALVAVARAAAAVRRHPAVCHNFEGRDAVDALDAALIPLIQEADHGRT